MWVLCTPRTGSSFLCELLNGTGLFPPYSHPRLTGVAGPLEGGRAFNEWLRLFVGRADFEAAPPRHVKAVFHQYVEVFASVPAGRRQGAGFGGYAHRVPGPVVAGALAAYGRGYVESVLPGVRFIELTRNAVDQAASTYVSRLTSRYHLYTEGDLRDYERTRVGAVDDRLLLECYRDVRGLRGCWGGFAPALSMRYEDLVADPLGELSRVLPGASGEVLAGAVGGCFGPGRRLFSMAGHPDKGAVRHRLSSLLGSRGFS